MTAYDKILKDTDRYTPDGWIMGRTNDPVEKKPGACIRMYMSKGQRQALYHLRERWGCITWKEFTKKLLKEYEIKVVTNGASR